ncbi:MAG: Gfo/Idh/MocA family protein [Rhodothermales bacterium]
MKGSINRRTFIKQTTAAGIGLGVMGHLSAVRGLAAPSNKIVVAVMGVNSRGGALARSFARAEGAEIAYICDVDTRAWERCIKAVDKAKGQDAKTPEGVTDFRRILDDQDVDALVIAAPDHWHAPATLLALQAGKHVYVEKPCGHNPREGELLVEAQRHHGRVVQMGSQQRSAPESIEAVQAIRDGLIGRPYFARAWYANTRKAIGRGQEAEVPDWLDYELWQGPAPRTPYRDNVVHYNWHWFWRWGTVEICNNGTHEIDVCRWALDVEYPVRVTSAGGRYHFEDDWEFYDTQVASFDFEGGKTNTWEGRSCNGRPIEGRGRGASIHGEKGTVILDRNGYVIYDNDNNMIKEVKRGQAEATLDTRGGGSLTDLHIVNFLDTIRGDAQPMAPIDEGHKSVLLCHLGNIAQHTGRTLSCDPTTGRILDDDVAMQLWGREYEPGWEPKV